MNVEHQHLDIEKALDRLRGDLGHSRLNKWWAKVEILGGLIAAGIGLLIGVRTVARSADVEIELAAAAIFLFSLGGYLALAGYRRHLYQSNNRLVAYLALLIRHSNRKD